MRPEAGTHLYICVPKTGTQTLCTETVRQLIGVNDLFTP